MNSKFTKNREFQNDCNYAFVHSSSLSFKNKDYYNIKVYYNIK